MLGSPANVIVLSGKILYSSEQNYFLMWSGVDGFKVINIWCNSILITFHFTLPS